MGLSPFENVFHLLGAKGRVEPDALDETGPDLPFTLPTTVRALYTTRVAVPLPDGSIWDVPLPDLWANYSNDEVPLPVSSLRALAESDRERHGRYRGMPEGRTLVPLIYENQGNFLLAFEVGPDPDPTIWVDNAELFWIPGNDAWVRAYDSLSEMVFDWIARYYQIDWTPLRFRSYDATPTDRLRAPVHRHANRIWLRHPRTTLPLPVLDRLQERFSMTRDGANHHFEVAGAHLTVTVATETQGSAQAAWWLAAEDVTTLAQARRLVDERMAPVAVPWREPPERIS